MNKFKIPTCSCDNCKNEEDNHSQRIIIPTQLPKELEQFLTFEQYKLLATECRKILDRSDIASKIGIGSCLMGILLSLLYIWVRHSILGLIILSATIITIVSSGILVAFLINKSTQSSLDKKINQFNIDFNSCSKGFRIEKNTKQYSSSNENDETPISKLTYIYIIYNIKKQNEHQEVIKVKSDEINEVVTHKFQVENNDFIVNIPRDEHGEGIILSTNNCLQSRGFDKISLIEQN
ncbi:hypothetical protein ACTFIU_008262 [Dictyostelium citrinum]